MITARIVEVGNLGAGIVSRGFTVLDRSTGRFTPYVRPGQFRPSTPLTQRKIALPQQTAAQNIAAQQARLVAMRKASDANIRRKQEQRREAIRQADRARQRKALEKPPAKRAGIKAWEAYYAKQRVAMPSTVRSTQERYDQAKFYAAVAGRSYLSADVIKAAGVGNTQGVARLFAVAYGGQTMPYWDAWYDRSMSAQQIAARVAADYSAEILRRVQVQAQNRAARELWQDTGKQGPQPIASRKLLPTLPAIPQPPERRASLPSISRASAFEPLPAFRKSSRGRVWEELPPLM